MKVHCSSSYRVTLRMEIDNKPGMFAKIASTIGAHGGNLDAVDLISSTSDKKIRDISFDCRDENHEKEIIAAVKQIKGVRMLRSLDLVFEMHLGGKITVENKMPVDTRDALSMAYTPGVARVCQVIAKNKKKAFQFTIKRHMVAVVTDGTAVLGLGDIGPEAALPVMEGKAMLFKKFGNVDAFPVCLDTKDPEEIIKTVKYIAPVFGGINLEDISAPRCFEIEDRLKAELDIPVFHDDQHGTAVVVAAALKNSLKIVKKKVEDIKVVVSGVGAAGVACSKLLMSLGVKSLIGVDRAGAIYEGRGENMNFMKQWFAENTNRDRVKGDLGKAIKGADVFLGVSAPGILKPEHVRKMAKDPIIFAMANPVPEIMPEEAEGYARIIATGRSDYPNQINNVLCFPGLFRGCLEIGASTINEAMKIAAADAIASVVKDDELDEDYIIPSVFDKAVARKVARAVSQAAIETNVAKNRPKHYIGK